MSLEWAGRLLVVLGLLGGLSGPLAASEAAPPGPRGVYLGLDYFTPLGDTGMHDMLYPVPGVLWQEGPVFVEARSFVILGIPDVLASVVDFLRGGEGKMPIWEGLNDGDQNPGCLKMWEVEFRWALYRKGGLRLDLGGLFDTWWMSPAVGGVHFGNLVWNLGPSAGLGLEGRNAAVNLSVNAGNGFSNSSNLNPFVGTELFGRVRIYGWLGVYARSSLRLQSQDYSDYESNNPAVSPKDFDIRVLRAFLSADAGLMVLF